MIPNFESLLKDVTEHVKNMANTETVIGEAFTLGEFTCVPIIRIGVGFGGGGGTGEDPKKGQGSGGGAGAGIGMEPLGFLVAHGDTIQILDVGHRGGLGAALEKIPDVLSKAFSLKKSTDNKQTLNETPDKSAS